MLPFCVFEFFLLLLPHNSAKRLANDSTPLLARFESIRGDSVVKLQSCWIDWEEAAQHVIDDDEKLLEDKQFLCKSIKRWLVESFFKRIIAVEFNDVVVGVWYLLNVDVNGMSELIGEILRPL